METSVCVEQDGMVESITGHKAMVRIHQVSACGHCNLQGFCNLSDPSGKVVESDFFESGLKVGDRVSVSLSRKRGNEAVFLGYFLPFVIVIAALLIFSSMNLREWITGLVALSALIPYYLCLYLFRERLQKNFVFTIHKKSIE